LINRLDDVAHGEARLDYQVLILFLVSFQHVQG